MSRCHCIYLMYCTGFEQASQCPVSMSPFTQFFFKTMHIMCCNNFITQCIPLFHHSMCKIVFSTFCV
ncbi:hypothetical protein E2C01_035715 [Portunus trituberculatus]|uniref:Uncharacterized protein n=1 Tax=Portunus trituberculatus TaxID=210409 RepID=A0A5B7F507_PORTR|nr:hypothetical protein [Portunus trituberculatus]